MFLNRSSVALAASTSRTCSGRSGLHTTRTSASAATHRRCDRSSLRRTRSVATLARAMRPVPSPRRLWSEVQHLSIPWCWPHLGCAFSSLTCACLRRLKIQVGKHWMKCALSFMNIVIQSSANDMPYFEANVDMQALRMRLLDDASWRQGQRTEDCASRAATSGAAIVTDDFCERVIHSIFRTPDFEWILFPSRCVFIAWCREITGDAQLKVRNALSTSRKNMTSYQPRKRRGVIIIT